MSQNRKGLKMKKLKFLFATLVFLALVLVCGQVKAASTVTITNAVDLGAALNNGGGNVTIDGTTVKINHDVTLTDSLYFYTQNGNDLTIDLNGYNLDFNYDSEFSPVAAIWSNSGAGLKIMDSSSNENNFIRLNRDELFSWNSSKGVLTIENVNIYTMWSTTKPVFGNSGVSTTNLKNSKVTTYGYITGGDNYTDYNFENVTIELAGNYEYAIKLNDHNNLTLKNCNFKSTNNSASGRFLSIDSNNAKATIDGGKYSYEGTNASNYLLFNHGGTLEIKDGEFTHKEGVALRNYDGNVTINNGVFDGRENAITATKDSILTIKGGYFKARPQQANDDKGAIAFSSSKTLADIVPVGYFMSDETVTKNSTTQFNETLKEVSVYAKPDSITFDKTELIYNGQNQAPTVVVKDTEGKTLQYDTDYTVQYPTNRKDVGEYTAKVVFIDRYETMPSKELTYKINKANYDMSKVKFENMTVAYDGKAHSIEATGLPTGVKAAYVNNGKVDLGKYEITASFIGDSTNYNPIPNKTAALTISQKNVADLEVSGIKDKTYTGKKLKQSLTIKNGDIVLTNGVDYSVEYKSNKKVGNATIVITGKGNYTGTVSKTFKIKPKGTSIKKLTTGSKRFKATWKAQKTQTTGYEVQYSTNSKFKSGNKKVKIKKNKTISTTVKKLKGKKKYYVRIRTYKSVNGKKIYSDWSKSKKVTTKK